MSDPQVLVHSSEDLLAKAVAGRMVTRMVDAQSATGRASVVLTGGEIGIQVLRELRDAPARDAVDWRRVDVWWGDERFVGPDDPLRNDAQAHDALLDHVAVDPDRLHPFPATGGGYGTDPEAAAEAYAAELAAATRPEDHGDVPRFDILLLGMGEDGHTASIFPESPAAHEEERSVVGVRGSPKPPPTRLSLTFRAIASAAEVWMVVSGRAKAPMVALALGGAGRVQVPAAGARARSRTLWLLDRDAAVDLPAALVGRETR